MGRFGPYDDVGVPSRPVIASITRPVAGMARAWAQCLSYAGKGSSESAGRDRSEPASSGRPAWCVCRSLPGVCIGPYTTSWRLWALRPYSQLEPAENVGA